MGSGTGARWVAVLVIYFTILIFTTTILESATNIDQDTDFDEDNLGTGVKKCGYPRDIYEPYTRKPAYDTSEETSSSHPEDKAHMECSKSGGVISNESCQSLPGCEWKQTTNWWKSLWGTDETDDPPTCVGYINFTDMTTLKQKFYPREYVIDNYVDPSASGYFENEELHDENLTNIGVCDHPKVINNYTRCKQLSCRWQKNEKFDEVEIGEINPGLGLLGQMWDVVKQMFTFRYDYGVDNETGEILLNFILFYLPTISLILSLYVMVRS